MNSLEKREESAEKRNLNNDSHFDSHITETTRITLKQKTDIITEDIRVLTHWRSYVHDYGSEGWGFESLRAR